MRFVITICLLIFLHSVKAQQSVDLILYHGKVYTVDKNFSVTEAIAIKDGKIIETGKNETILSKYNAKESINLNNKAVYPGFIDAHAHMIGYALGLLEVDLTNTKSWQECLTRFSLFKQQKNIKAKQWIKGRGWDQNDWSVKEFPNKRLLDSLFPDNPVYLTRIDGHAAIVNSAAIKISGLKAGQQIIGGDIEVKNGELTGILIDNAQSLISKFIPAPAFDDYKIGLQEAEKNCFAAGLTTIVDCGLAKFHVDLFNTLQVKGDFKMRMVVMLSDIKSNYDYFLKNGPFKSQRLNVNAFKLYADGALGSRGACLLLPYSDRPDWQGFTLKPRSYFDSILPIIYQSKFQACTHAIGDSGNRMILQIYSKLLDKNNDRRWRIEHAQVINENDFHFFGEHKIIPSVQPTHATSDMYWAEERLGKERIKTAYAYKKLLNQNECIPLGTDFPVEDINPLMTFYAAIARKDKKNYPSNGFQIENALTREQALRGMTIWAAYASFEENEKGSIESGKYADLVILDHDIIQSKEKDLLITKVLMTILNGEIVYWKKD